MNRFFLSISCVATALYAHDDDSLNDRFSLSAEFAYMRRSQIHRHTLVQNGSNSVLMTTHTLLARLPTEPGYRVELAYTFDARSSIEARYLWIKEWHTKMKVISRWDLTFPFNDSNFAADFTKASGAYAHYNSSFQDGEINYWRYITPRRIDLFSVGWLAGIRYVNLAETFRLSMIRDYQMGNYFVKTWNHMPGLQVGGYFQLNSFRWMSWDLVAKVGGLVDAGKNSVFLADCDDTIVLRQYHARQVSISLLSDVEASLTLRPWRYCNLRASYGIIYINGAALAPEQVDREVEKINKHYSHAGSVLIHGVYAGLNFVF